MRDNNQKNIFERINSMFAIIAILHKNKLLIDDDYILKLLDIVF